MSANAQSCPHCGGSRLRRFDAIASDLPDSQRVSIMECSSCVFAWQWPVARSFEGSVRHAEGRYKHESEHGYYAPDVRRRVATEQVDYLATLRTPGRRLLDVGAGDGAFARVAAEHGWRSLGIDPAAPTSACKDGHMLRGTLEDLPRDEFFDVITLWDVIEHVEAPMDVLVLAAQYLQPGGLLVVETGNYQSGDRILAGDAWWCYAADHRWYFAPPIVESMLQGAGMIDIVLAPRVLRPGWSGKARYRPWLGGRLHAIAKRPHRFVHELLRYANLRDASARWPDWSGLGIFAMVGRVPDGNPAL